MTSLFNYEFKTDGDHVPDAIVFLVLLSSPGNLSSSMDPALDGEARSLGDVGDAG